MVAGGLVNGQSSVIGVRPEELWEVAFSLNHTMIEFICGVPGGPILQY